MLLVQRIILTWSVLYHLHAEVAVTGRKISLHTERMIFFLMFYNISTEINKQDTRLPPGFFARSNIVERYLLVGWNRFFSKLSVSSFFLAFPTSLFFWFSPKNLKNKLEIHFQEKTPFETHCGKNLLHLAILKKFKIFEKNQSIFPKNPYFERFENSFFSSRILRQICYNLAEKIFSRSDVNKIADVGVNAIGKHRVKKRQK